MNILGISAFYHDSAACLIKNGVITAAVQEERFTRKKHDASFPINAINYCLKFLNDPNDINCVVLNDKPLRKFERLYHSYLAYAPKGFETFRLAIPKWLKSKKIHKREIEKKLFQINPNIDWAPKILFSEHHLSHAASAFYPSPFEKAAILTIDGVGEWTTSSLALGNNKNIEIIKEINFPHSLGLLYATFTSYTGFKVNSGEYKVMGLAPYGKPKFVDLIKDNLIDIKHDGSFSLNMEYFDFPVGFSMTNEKFHDLFGGKPRESESLLTQREMDLAASIQSVTEEVLIKIARDIAKTTREKNLCLAGGVALNCVGNGKLLSENLFDKIWIQPAAGDAGGALGAALSVHHLMLKSPRNNTSGRDLMKGSYLGPSYNQDEITESLKANGAVFKVLKDDEIINKTAQELAKGKAAGWMCGRMEFGPRSLGARSILADPRNPEIQKTLNLKVKFRESFRPFAPSVLEEFAAEWFDMNSDSPYMLLVTDVAKDKQYKMSDQEESLFGIDKLNIERSKIPAVTHVDYSARVQTVHKETNPKFHELLKQFHRISGCPILVNTSFNVRGEPIVCSPEDAFKCFMGTGLDILVIENIYMEKEWQVVKQNNYQDSFEKD